MEAERSPTTVGRGGAAKGAGDGAVTGTVTVTGTGSYVAPTATSTGSGSSSTGRGVWIFAEDRCCSSLGSRSTFGSAGGVSSSNIWTVSVLWTLGGAMGKR